MFTKNNFYYKKDFNNINDLYSFIAQNKKRLSNYEIKGLTIHSDFGLTTENILLDNININILKKEYIQILENSNMKLLDSYNFCIKHNIKTHSNYNAFYTTSSIKFLIKLLEKKYNCNVNYVFKNKSLEEV